MKSNGRPLEAIFFAAMALFAVPLGLVVMAPAWAMWEFGGSYSSEVILLIGAAVIGCVVYGFLKMAWMSFRKGKTS